MILIIEAVFFSLLVDESNDRGVEAKDLVVLLRFFDMFVMKAVTRFIDLPTANDGTAAAIFAKIDECLVSQGLQYQHLICFNSDTCNTRKDKGMELFDTCGTNNQIFLIWGVFAILKI